MNYKTGFIGLGNMGMPMATNVLKKHGQLTVFNRSQGNCLKLKEQGAEIAASAGELMERSGLVFLSLPGPVQVEEIVAGENGLLSHAREGQIIVDTSTVSPLTSRTMAAKAAEKGVIYIDAPVSGGGAGAARGALTVMLGAEKQEIERLGILPYMDAFANTYHYIGKRGTGSAIKIINNYMAFTTQVVNGEALAMADRLGISPEVFYRVITSSSGNSAVLNAKRDKVLTGDEAPGFAVDLVMKDLELARALCQDSLVPNFTLNTAIQFYRMAQAQGLGKNDSSSVIRVIRETEAKETGDRQ